MGGCIDDAKLGESCAATACLPGLYCARGMQTCVTPAPLGGACEPRDEDSCALPNFCEAATRTCVPPGKAGAPCDFLRERDECEPDLACNLMNTCNPVLENGAACVDDTGCLSDFCEAGVCATRVCH